MFLAQNSKMMLNFIIASSGIGFKKSKVSNQQLKKEILFTPIAAWFIHF